MDRPPEPKRMRIDPNSWPPNDGTRYHLPPPPVTQPPHRHPDVPSHYGPPEDQRRLSHPSSYDQYGPSGPRDPVLKLDPGAERPQLHDMRPHPAGHPMDGRPKPPDDPRVQGIPGYDPSNGPPQLPPQPMHQYIPPPSPLGPPPQPPYTYERHMYEQSSMEPHREPIYAEYTGSVSTTQKKRTPRTSQACEACRMAKAKCTDPKPCQGCVDKRIPCKYDPPPPKQVDRVQSDLMSKLDAMMDTINWIKKNQKISSYNAHRQEIFERALVKVVPGLAEKLNETSNGALALKEEDEDDDDDEMNSGSGRPGPPRYGAASDSQVFRRQESDLDPGVELDDSDQVSDNEVVKSVPRGEPAIPVGHTTGAAKILQWPAIADMVGEKMKEGRMRGVDPLRREMRRGVIRLYGRGEGVEKYGYDKDVTADYAFEPPRSSSDSHSETTARSPAMDNYYGQIGGASPVSETYLYRGEHQAKGAVDVSGLPELDEATVRRLSAVYMAELNVMHPIITQKELDHLIALFLRQIRDTERGRPAKVYVGFVGSESNKRKRSPTLATPEHPFAANLKPGRPQRSIETAIILIILALGKICEHREKIPDVLPGNPGSSASSPSANPFSPSPMQQSPVITNLSSNLPSPTQPERRYLRRGSTDGSLSGKYPPYARNLDVIPGLAYFAIATDILGNHIGCTQLGFVHACLLAGLYHGQLGRVIQSHGFIKEAGYTLSTILTQHLPRFKKMQEDMSDPVKGRDVVWHSKDNQLLFAFWTCLQLESDIVAELEVPQSAILSLESIMPWPNLQLAYQNQEMTEKAMKCYSAQLYFRKMLNNIHRDLYGPGKEDYYSLETANKLPSFPYIDTIIEDLKSVIEPSPGLKWEDGAPPADNILEARLRAKMYGGQVITYRHFLRMVLNSKYTHPSMGISKPILAYAEKCIRAMFYSTQAFWGMKGGRLIVTNVWGTSHAQWGHCLVLHAAYLNPCLSHLIDPGELREVTLRVRQFLIEAAQPSSALADDIRILDYAAQRSGLLASTAVAPAPRREMNRSFSSTGSDATPRV